MYRNTRFGEVMKGVSRGSFNRAVERHQADKYCKGFSSWDQMLAMVYAQLSQCRSLREVETGFNNQAMHHYHLGTRTVKRSTLSDANSKKEAGVFMETCQLLMSQVHRKVRKEISHHLHLLDSTSITLAGPGFDEWTESNRTRHTQGVKVHMLFEPETEVPKYFNISAANVNDITDAQKLDIESGITYVFDKGYCDYNWWHKINKQNAFFVTRFKRNAGLTIVETKDIPEEDKDIILSDSLVRFKNKHPRAKHINEYDAPLRQVIVARPDHDTPLIFATNDFERSAVEIANCYKARWQVELFFKWLKQNLKIKKYFGRNENAVRIQIITAIISYLLIALYRHSQQMTSSMKDTLILIGTSLFQHVETELYLLKKRRKIEQDILALKQGILL